MINLEAIDPSNKPRQILRKQRCLVSGHRFIYTHYNLTRDALMIDYFRSIHRLDIRFVLLIIILKCISIESLPA